ncbi:MAG: PAS domain S-box protein [bacterium]|nr:PAS domain S-box protein [bacterium]
MKNDEKGAVIRRILIIDDNPDIFSDFKTVLQGEQDTSDLDRLNVELFGDGTDSDPDLNRYRLDYAPQGKEGYEKVKQALEQDTPYQLAFVDMRMPPGWDGLETIEQIWKIDPNLQVTICTAYSDHSYEEITKRLGFTDRLLILKKPFDTVEVSQIASAMTEKWSLARRAELKLEQMEQKTEARTLELAEANQRLRESEDQFRTLLERAGDPILTFDPVGQIVGANREACKTFGYSREELLNMWVHHLDILWEINEYKKKFWDKLYPTQPVTFETLYKRKDGGTVPVEVRMVIVNFSSRPVVLALARDITERKRMEEERIKLEGEVQRREKLESLNLMAGSIAHNFNNLLSVVKGNLELSLMDTSPEHLAYSSIKSAEKATLRAAELSTRMLTYVGQNLSSFDSISLTDLVGNMLDKLSASIPGTIAMETRLSGNPEHISGSGDQLNQVVTNLFSNALEAIGDKKGTITITTSRMTCDHDYLRQSYLDEDQPEGEYVYLEVTDTGCGMDEETKSKVFDPYFTTKFIGRGLGLASVLGIVRGHKGVIVIQTQPNHGTTFRVLFPKA